MFILILALVMTPVSKCVKEAYKELISNITSNSNPDSFKTWSKTIPCQVSCLVWKVFHNRIPTKYNFARRGAIEQGNFLAFQ